jgi:hypothetical protein
MKCRYCNIALAPLRSLTDNEFCCDDHRHAFAAKQIFDAQPPPLNPEPVYETAPELETAEVNETEAGLESEQPLESEPAYDTESEYEPDLDLEEVDSMPAHAAREIAASWRWLTAAWKSAPRDLKTLGLLVPLLLGLAVGPSVTLPKVELPQVDTDQVARMMTDQWRGFQQSISNRAAIAFADDFRSGLDAWNSRANLTSSWSYDAAGFVRPGPLAVFKPTVDLTDYRFEFLGEIDQKGLGCAFRAPNLDNYYAVKFAVVRPGPLPMVRLVRYAVINGREGPRVEKPLPITVRADSLYRVLVDVRGGDFTIMAQGQIVDFWSDRRLSHGGVGFFCNRGERARVRWVEVSHQYDTLGRLCAYLAPYGMESRNGNWN